jgi:hypothetical protein
MEKTVTHRDRLYTEDEAVQISTLRAERWGLLLMFEELQKVNGAAAKKKAAKAWRRIEVINTHLHKLTKNPIYNT